MRFHLLTGALIDPRQSSDKLTLQLTQGIAEYQSALKSEALRNVYGSKRERGELRSMHKAFGWQWEKGNPKRSMLAEPTERDLIQEAYRRVLKSETLYALAADWNERGIATVGKSQKWSVTALRSMLLRPSNALLIRDGNGFGYVEGNRGKWDRLIDDETYFRARELLLSPSRRTAPGRKHIHLVSGIVRCGQCGKPLRSSSVGDKETGGRIPIYRCVTKITMPTDRGVRHVSARCAALDAVVRREVVNAFIFGPANLFPDVQPSHSAELHDELDSVLNRRQELASLVAEGVLSAADVRGQLVTLKSRETALRADLSTAQASEGDSMRLADLRAGLWRPGRVSIDAAAAYAGELGARFDALTIETRRALVRHLLNVEVLPLGPGVYGSRRWSITHRDAISLNESADAA